jgi:hypothetical protein
VKLIAFPIDPTPPGAIVSVLTFIQSRSEAMNKSVQTEIVRLQGELAVKTSAWYKAMYRRDFLQANRLGWDQKSIGNQIDALMRQLAN